MEKLTILFGAIFILLILITILCIMVKDFSDQCSAAEEEIWRITKENSRLINELVKFIKTEDDGRN